MSRHTLLITFPYSPIKQYLAFSRHRESESKQVFDWIVLLFSEIYNESFYLSEMKSSADMSKMNLANNPLNYMSFYITSSWNLCCKLDHQGVLSRNIRLDLDKLQARLVYRRVHMCVDIFLMQYHSTVDRCTSCLHCTIVDMHLLLPLLKKKCQERFYWNDIGIFLTIESKFTIWAVKLLCFTTEGAVTWTFTKCKVSQGRVFTQVTN